jgi:DNA-binding LacI/PurR family transcriptional regulator
MAERSDRRQYAYEHVAEDLLRRMRRGQWKKDDRIPALNELERIYPHSRMTLYRALQHLTARGHLTMSHGRGTFVRAAHTRPRIAILAGPEFFEQSIAPFAFQVFRHAHAQFAGSGMDSQLYAEDPHSPIRLPPGLLEEMERGRLDGLLTIDGSFPVRFMADERWRKLAVPHVNVGSLPSPYRVYVDAEAFLKEASRLAVEAGRRRIAVFKRAGHHTDALPGLKRRLHAQGAVLCPDPPQMPPESLPFEDYGYELMRHLWAQDPKPDAIVIPDDVIAKGAAQAALALGVRVPRDCLLLAMTNSGARFFYPVPILALEVDVEAVAAKAVQMLVDLINGVPLAEATVLIAPGRRRDIDRGDIPEPHAVRKRRRQAGTMSKS